MILKKYQFHYSLITNTNKPFILFLHGFIGNFDEFNETIKLLSNEFSYLTLDLPGHGKTQIFGTDEYYNIANTAQALIALLDELQISQCFLIGYSMGGRLALYLTRYFPERFIKVILESASPGLATDVERLARIKHDAQIANKLGRSIDKHDFAVFLDNWYKQPIFGNIKNHPQYKCMVKNRLQNDPLELVKSLRFMGTGSQPSLWEEIENIQIPMLLLVGEYDEKFVLLNKKIIDKSEVAQLKMINNVGHNIHFENTVIFVQHIKDFLINN